jgi:hypothetical protein
MPNIELAQMHFHHANNSRARFRFTRTRQSCNPRLVDNSSEVQINPEQRWQMRVIRYCPFI